MQTVFDKSASVWMYQWVSGSLGTMNQWENEWMNEWIDGWMVGNVMCVV